MELPTNYVLHLILIDNVNKIWIDEDVQKPHSTSDGNSDVVVVARRYT